MKQYLLPKEGKFYKANLHMHTTISDGRMTLEETKEEYQKRGYSIVAFTDHEILLPHEDLTDENFLAITSVEYACNKPTPVNDFSDVTAVHINIYSPEPGRTYSPIFSENRFWIEHTKQYVTDEMRKSDYKMLYGVDKINHMIRLANEQGFLVSYNHPVWSLQNYPDYAGLNGVWGVEVHNHGCAIAGYPDTVVPFDDLLRQGKRVVPLATDDAHSMKDCFGGFNMIKAQELTYDAIFDAMKKGDLYASTGPEIYDLYVEDGEIHVSCSPAAEIMLTTDRRYAGVKKATDGPLTEAVFGIKGFFYQNEEITAKTDHKPYVRITVKDMAGNCAYTRAYFEEELKI
ncbi:MAG: PHP domain-containing protein [Clostridia bacterium]|nr:PHP domain-containing protein [Clostridia bacterium]